MCLPPNSGGREGRGGRDAQEHAIVQTKPLSQLRPIERLHERFAPCVQRCLYTACWSQPSPLRTPFFISVLNLFKPKNPYTCHTKHHSICRNMHNVFCGTGRALFISDQIKQRKHSHISRVIACWMADNTHLADAMTQEHWL